MVGGCWDCSLQCLFVASGDGAGGVFDEMVARAPTSPNGLNFGVLVEGGEGSLVVCLCGQVEPLLCTKWEWSWGVLFLDSIFEIPTRALGYEIG